MRVDRFYDSSLHAFKQCRITDHPALLEAVVASSVMEDNFGFKQWHTEMDKKNSDALARRYEVRQRRRLDPMSISAAADFRYGKFTEVEPLAALQNRNVTLYCLNRRRNEAVFVECDNSESLEHYPFYYQGQFRNANAAIVMPLDAMHSAASELGDRFQHAVMIHSVGRCGSTLLSKMFSRLDCCLSLSEPDVQTNLIVDRYSPDETVALLRSAARLYYQPQNQSENLGRIGDPCYSRGFRIGSNGNNAPSHLVMKFRSFCIELADAMAAATPAVKSVFLYRDMQRAVRSGMRVFRYAGAPLWWADRFHRAVITRGPLAIGLWWNIELGRRMFPVMQRFTPWELSKLGAIGLLGIAWLSAMERCVQLQRAGFAMPAICYDDLIARPREIASALAVHCDLPSGSGEEMITAMGEDSQRDSVVQRARQSNYELTPRDHDTLRLVLSRSEIVDSTDFAPDVSLGDDANAATKPETLGNIAT